tara:strand:+ start:208 stop:492 length:285 start_codon:yes stop_codon:yes gene_type:complete
MYSQEWIREQVNHEFASMGRKIRTRSRMAVEHSIETLQTRGGFIGPYAYQVNTEYYYDVIMTMRKYLCSRNDAAAIIINRLYMEKHEWQKQNIM